MHNSTEEFEALSPAKRALLTIETLQARIDALERIKTEPIAVIGMSCRFPGGAGSPEAFWQLLCNGFDAITAIPEERWNSHEYDTEGSDAASKATHWAGLVDQVDQFDPYFFGITPREAIHLDPQQRLLLEVSWEACERAGITQEKLRGSQTGVFFAIYQNDYSWLQFGDPASIDAYSALGNAHTLAANRFSYLFDLHGPSLVVDTACSSSLVATHLACQSLRLKECHMALVGGSNLILSPLSMIAPAKWGMLAADGRCKTFDARADGFVRGEGCGVIILKRLSDALNENDPILAIIRGSAVSQDGRSNGLTAPNGQAQQEVIQKALHNSGVSSEQITYVETHGTGTALGDPIEVEALSHVFAQSYPQGETCKLGAVKTNVGHLEAAAGIAGLIKTVLCLQHRQIPPNLHFETLNPHISLEKSPFVLPTSLCSWEPGTGERLAGVSSFGLGGTNAHVILEEYHASPSTKNREKANQSHQIYVLPLSARSREALYFLAQQYTTFFAAYAHAEAQPFTLYDVCYTASINRTHYEYRLALRGETGDDLLLALQRFTAQNTRSESSSALEQAPIAAQPRIAFIFPGQGSQWVGMGRKLLKRYAAFRSMLEACEQAMRPYVDWSLIEELESDRDQAHFERVDVLQPMLFAVEVALAALWRSWGVEPQAVAGHSMGEVAAAYTAGALSLQDAAKIICLRSQLLLRVHGKGAMAVVDLPVEQTARLLQGKESLVSIAASNSPRSTVISGEPVALEQILHTLRKDEIFCRWIKVDVASHSPQMEPLRDDLLQALQGIYPQDATIPIISTVTGLSGVRHALDASYWVQNLRQPVYFSSAIQHLLSKDFTIFIEMSPHPILLSAIEEGLLFAGRHGLVLPSLKRLQEETLQDSLCALYTSGYTLDWQKIYPNRGNHAPVPTYSWQHERYWVTDHSSPAQAHRQKYLSHPSVHPLLGMHVEPATQEGTHLWQQVLSVETVPYLADHKIQDTTLLPGSAYLEMALAAAQAYFGSRPYVVEDMTYAQALILNDDVRETQVTLAVERSDVVSMKILSREVPTAIPVGQIESAESFPWVLHATGSAQLISTDKAIPAIEQSIDMLQQQAQQIILKEDFYRKMQERGLHYGPRFQIVERIWRLNDAALARLDITPHQFKDASNYKMHPILLDAALQVLGEAASHQLEKNMSGQTIVPIGVRRLRLFAPPEKIQWSYARLAIDTDACNAENLTFDRLEGTVLLLDASGQVVAEIDGIRVQALAANEQVDNERSFTPERWLYELAWQEAALEEASLPTLPAEGIWLLCVQQPQQASGYRTTLLDLGQRVLTLCLEESEPEQQATALIRHWSGAPETLVTLLQELPPSWQSGYLGVLWLTAPLSTAQDALATQELLDGYVQPTQQVLALVQGLLQLSWRDLPRLWLLTRGAVVLGTEQSGPGQLAHTPLWGLARTLAYEHPRLRCSLIDLSPHPRPEEQESEQQAVLRECLHGGLATTALETQVVLRGARRWVARLRPSQGQEPEGPAAVSQPAGTQPFGVQLSGVGMLEHLHFVGMSRRSPGPGEVEIEVAAAGLNFLDVLTALGVIPTLPDASGRHEVHLGGECAGRIVALGEGVSSWQLGQEVIALAPDCFATHVIAPTRFLWPKPARLSMAQAASVPIVFTTAWLGLHHLARLHAGERVLIHAAAGGVGLAAVQLAQQVGAEIFATAGSTQKRGYLREQMGVRHIYDSRSLRFAEQIREETAGVGVDVVLNSLAGDFLSSSLHLLAEYGRFIEIGKRDYLQDRQLGMRPFLKNLTLSLLDLRAMSQQRPAQVQAALTTILQQIDEGRLQPLPIEVYPIEQLAHAFRHMAQGQHLGKIVLDLQQREQVPLLSQHEPAVAVRKQGTYLLSGGAGGLGLQVARWLGQQGAGHLVLLGRRAESQEVEMLREELASQGTGVTYWQGDVAQPEVVAQVLAHIQQTLPPLRGIVHAAGVLQDATVQQLTVQQLRAVMEPKIAGAWNLHRGSQGQELDWFVLFSSAASLLGSPGQANYAAANAFLDGLAQARRQAGQVAVSINWGPWAQVGMAAQQANRGERMENQGIANILPQEGLQVLHRLLKTDKAQVGVIPLDTQMWRQSYDVFGNALLLDLVKKQNSHALSSQESAFQKTLLATESGKWAEVLEAHLEEQIARVLRIPNTRLNERVRLSTLGFDSLTSLELRNHLESSLGLQLPATLIWAHSTVGALVEHLLGRLKRALNLTIPLQEEQIQENQKQDPALLELEQLPEDEVNQLLLEELSSLPAEYLDRG